jgi:hypothetical protein
VKAVFNQPIVASADLNKSVKNVGGVAVNHRVVTISDFCKLEKLKLRYNYFEIFFKEETQL